MKERQRWQPEEDALLRAYVKQYGPKEWNLVSQRMGKPLDRDAKSCLERWKNYLKPGIKKGSLTDEEQSLVICLQAKYGNKWKKIAAEVPGRTAKRLGKWWEVFKEKQLKEKRKQRQLLESCSSRDIGRYDHILETFAEKYVQRKICPANLPPLLVPCPSSSASSNPLLSLGGPTSTGEAAFSDKFLSNLKSPTTTREAAFSDSFLSNLKSPPPATAAAEMSMPQMENGSVVAVGPSCLSELKGKVIPASGSDMGPALTLESLGGTTRSTQQLPPEPKLALQCNASAMELDLSSASLGSSAFVDSNSSLPAWMSTAPPPPPPVSQSTSALPSCSASRATADKEATFLSKTVHINTSPSVSLSLSPTSSELIVSSGSASPASEVVAPRSWLQELNGASGAAVFKETKVNLPWCFSEKQIGLLSLEPGHSHSNRLGFRSPTDPARMSLEAASDDPLPLDPSAGKQNMENMILQQLSTFLQYCKDLEESRHSWFMHKKEATWRLNRLEQQLESEKARKRREKIEEIGAKIRALREEEMVYLEKLDSECKEQLCSLQKEAEMKEAKMVELWAAKHLQLTKFIEQMVCQCSDVQRLVKNDMK